MSSLQIHTTYENPLTSLEALLNAEELASLEITGDFIKSNLPFSKLVHLNELENLVLETDLGKQAAFVNQQTQLRYLHLKKLDASGLQVNPKLEYLRIDTALKNEQLLPGLFPDLKTLHLHGCSRLTDFGFLSAFSMLEVLYVGYNAHLTGLPEMKCALKIKSIKLPNAYNFTNGKSLLQFTNLETIWLTSHDKSLTLSVEDFEALQQLPQLKTVYTVWGRKTIPEVENIYHKTGWVNSGLG